MESLSYWLEWKPKKADIPPLTGAKSDKKDATEGAAGGSGSFVTCHLASSPKQHMSFGSSVTCHPGPVLCEQPGPLSEVPPPFRDHAPYAEDFSRWALAACVFRDGCLGGVAALLEQFCDWRIALKGEGGPWLATFAALLESEGFTLGSALTAGMVYGLVLKAEYVSLTTPGHMAKEAAWNGKRR